MSFMRLKVRLQGHTKIFRWNYGVWKRKFLKRIVIYLPSTNDNKINVFHSDVKNVPYTGPHKRFLIYYDLCLETTGNIF